MGRSMSTETLSMHNFSKGTDSIVVNHDYCKMDQTRNKNAPKHAHANPFDWKICPFVAI